MCAEPFAGYHTHRVVAAVPRYLSRRPSHLAQPWCLTSETEASLRPLSVPVGTRKMPTQVYCSCHNTLYFSLLVAVTTNFISRNTTQPFPFYQRQFQ